MLSAQTTDKKVNEVTPGLFELANNPKDMALQSVADIKECIKYIGLSNTKAKNLQKLSEIIHTKHSGDVPNNYQDLEALPGVGHKTASVVMSQAFGEPAFPVDTHIHRLAYRWGLSNGKNVVQTEKDLKRLFSKNIWNDLHIQMILFGREHCPARGHKPETCPICSWAGIQKRLKEEKKKR
jgi:endonuclease-3